MSATQFNVGLKVTADAAQYTGELTRAGQTTASFSQQVQAADTAAQAMGNGLRAAATAAQANQAAGVAMLAALRDQVATTGKSTEELLRYRAAQAGVAAEAAPLILQLQNQRAAQQLAAESARAEEAAQRANAAAKQQSAAAQESFLAGLRDQAALQGKTQAEVMRYRAAQLGVAEGAEQYIRALEQGASANRVGALSAKEHAMAMRMLPMQMTDVVTSMASGMPIWMVAIQQGGQIKDSFGGVGNALRAVLGAITPTVAGIGLLAGAAGLGAAAYYQGSREADGYRQAIVMTGNAADTTVNQLTDMARAMSAISGTQGAAAESLTALAGTGAIASENLQQFATVAMDLERRVGQPIKTTAQHLEELGKAPVQASLKLNEQYHYLTEAVYSQIKALQDQGKQEEAASLAQRTYANAMAERTAELRSNLGTLERLWEGLGNTARRAWDAMLNVGRAATLSDVRAKIEETNSQLNDLLMGTGFDSTGGGAATGAGGRGRAAQIERLKKQLSDLYSQAAPLEAEEAQAQIRAEKQATDAIELAARQRIDTLKKNVRTQAEIRKQEIDQLDRDRETLKLSTEEYNALLAGINEKYKDKKTAGAGGIKVSDSELANLQGQLEAARLYGQQLATLGAGASELNAGERESLKIGEELARVTDVKTAARLREKQAIADALGVQLRSNDGLEKSLKAHQSLIDTTFKDSDAITQRATAQEAANSVFGKGRTAIEQMTLAELEHQMAEAQASDSFDPKYIASLELKIAAQKRYVASLQGTDYKAAEQHVNELLRGAQELAKTYADEQALSGLTALEREKIVAQRQVELKYAKELAAIDAKALTDDEKQVLREKVLQAQRIESAAAVAKAQESYMARASDEINRSLTDALMRGFESGKGAAENLADTVVNLFKTMVLRPTISAVMTPVSVAINGIVQQGLNAVGLGSSSGNLLGMASNASSLYSLGNSVLGNALTAAGGWLGLGGAATSLGLSAASAGAGAIGAGIGAGLGMGSGAAAAGTGLGLSLGGSGLGLTAGSAGAGAIGAGLGTSAAATGGAAASGSVLGALGAIPGWGWALAGVALLAGLGGAFKGSTPHIGGAASYSAAGGTTTGLGVLDQGLTFGVNSRYYDQGVEQQSASIAQTLVGLLDATAQSFGTQAGYFAATAFADDSSKDGAWGSLMVRLGDKVVLNWADTQTGRWAPKEFGDGEEGHKQYLAAIAASARDALTTAIGDADWAREMLDALGDSPTLETLGTVVQQIGQIQALFTSLGNNIQGFAGYANDAITALLKATGGAENLASLTNSYYQNYYTEAERTEALTRQLTASFAELGYELPKSREELRALVNTNIALGAAGASNVAGLLSLEAAFAQITRSAQDAAAETERAAKAQADARKAATDAAWAAMQKSIAAARDAAQAEMALRQERLASASAVVDLSRSQARELRGLVDSTVAMTAAQAGAYIDNALTAARSTGYLPDAEGLRQAITDARAGMGTDAFSSRLDYEAAQLILANKLDALGDVGDAQLTTDELLLQQAKNEVERLDLLIKTGREALDEARGNTVAVQGVEAAVKAFYDKLFAENKDAADGGAKPGAGFAIGGSGPGGDSGGGTYDKDAAVRATVGQQLALGSAKGLGHEDKSVLQHINAAVYGTGITQADIAKAYGLPEEDVRKLFDGAGIPRFARGGQHAGGLRLVGEDGPELEVTGPARIYNAGQTQQLLAGLQGGASADVTRLLQELLAQGYAIGRRQIELLQTMENLARKGDAIGVKQRVEAVV